MTACDQTHRSFPAFQCVGRTAGFLLAAALTLTLLPPIAHADFAPEQLCVQLMPGSDITKVNERWGTETIASLPERNIHLLYAPGVEDVEQLAAQMSEDDAVDLAEANYHLATPEAVRQMVVGAVGGTWDDFHDQFMGERIGLDLAHQTATGEGVVVAILDTGIDPDHELFEDRLSSALSDFVDNDPWPWETANGVDDDGDSFVDEGYGHGTMVAGLVSLVAPDATLMPLRVLDDEGAGSVFQITQAMVFALQHGADIINLSLGVPLSSEFLEEQINWANSHGVLIVAAAGNENRENPPYYPAYVEDAFMVTALDSADIKAEFADFNPRVTVSAPGTGIRSAYPGNDWGLGSGCSFATPLVSGEVALALNLDSDLTREEVETILSGAVEPIYQHPENQPYLNKLGSGRIYLPLAVGTSAVGSESIPYPAVHLRPWPNPSFGQTTFVLEKPLRVATGVPESVSQQSIQLEILDPSGRVLSRVPRSAEGTFRWAGTDQGGIPVAAGIYYARLGGDIEWPHIQAVPVVILR